MSNTVLVHDETSDTVLSIETRNSTIITLEQQTSVVKTTGEQGPPGPPGKQGEVGPQGPMGIGQATISGDSNNILTFGTDGGLFVSKELQLPQGQTLLNIYDNAKG